MANGKWLNGCVRLKLDFNGLWLGVYCREEAGTYMHRSGIRERWRNRVCISLVPFVTLVLFGRWRNSAGQVLD